MNKYLKIAIVSVIVIGVFVFALLVTGKQAVKSIDYDEFTEISNGDGFVYYGSEETKTSLKEIANLADIEIGILDSTEFKSEKLKEDTFYKYENGKVVYKYTGDINSYKFKESLMEEELLEKSYLTISLDEYKDIIKEKGYHFMFIGSEQCGYCTQFKDSIKESLKDNNYKVYYIDISTLSEDEYNELVKTDEYMSQNEWGTPLNLLYKDGKRIDELNGYVSSDELVEFLKENKVI